MYIISLLTLVAFSLYKTVIYNVLLLDNLKKLRDEYLNGSKEMQIYLEKRYGKQAIQLAVEEAYSNEWLDQFSKPCPGCGAHIQVSTCVLSDVLMVNRQSKKPIATNGWTSSLNRVRGVGRIYRSVHVYLVTC